ncbi:hypothetical protein HKD37_17G048238 [Glycine soja]
MWQFVLPSPAFSLSVIVSVRAWQSGVSFALSSHFVGRMNDNITLILHHGGRFTPRASDGKVEYIGGEFNVWEDISADCLNASILYDLVKASKKYSNIGECFWLIDKDLDFNHGDSFENENEINVYFHHEVDPILEEVPQMLYLECDPIPKTVENEDDLDDVPIAGHEEDVGAGEHVGAREQRDAESREMVVSRGDADAGEQRDGGGEERDVADSDEEKEGLIPTLQEVMVQRGRPKKNRRRSIDEDNVTGHRLKRKLPEFTCGRCGQTNHNIRSCKNIGVLVRPKKYVAPSTSNEDDHLLSQDEQTLNEAKEAAAHVQQDPVEINLSQPHLSQDSDMELMVPTTIVPPIARNKLTITRAKQRKVADKDDANSLPGFLLVLAVQIAARLPWCHCRMKLPENAQQLPLVDMEKSSEQAAATEPQKRRRRSDSAWETSRFVNPNLFGEEEEATLREREFIDADLSATLDSLRGIELPPMHLTNAVT